jgi:hypothetical protein
MRALQPAGGDLIILEVADGKFEIHRLASAGEREFVRAALPSLHHAWEIARALMTFRARIWVGHIADPDNLKPY